jgi:starch synthase
MMNQSGPLKILMATSEAFPFAKVGGLGEAVSSLAAELSRAGHDVRIVLPRYYFIESQKEGLKALPEPLGVPLGVREEWTAVYSGTLPDSKVPVYFLDHEACYGRDGVYGTRSVPFFADNGLRFALLSRGAFQLCRMLHWIPDIIHGHDWPTALCSAYLASLEKNTEFASTAGVFTIHNIGYQGILPKEDMVHLGLSWEHFYTSGFEYFDKINLLKSGIMNADYITTVSPGYAGEILQPELGYNMDGLLRGRENSFSGILNGIDYDIWDPEKDPFLSHHFSADDLSGKEKLKDRLQMEVGLPETAQKPLIGMVSRIVDQKGFGELLRPDRNNLFSICRDLDCQIVILGTGDALYEEELAHMAWKLPNLKVILQFNNALAHLIEGGADFFLMPSLYEPCGLNQIYSLRYGAVPIVSNTGGLADTVEKYDPSSGNGTGFIIDKVSPESIYAAVKEACLVFRDRQDHILKLRKKGMEQRFSWEKSAGKYVEAYHKALENRKNRAGSTAGTP